MLNRDNTPMFVIANRQEVIDIIVATVAISSTVHNWHVSDELSLSDHRFDIESRIYKTCIRPIMTYAAETRADTRKTKEIARVSEMKILRSIVGCSLRNRIPNTEIRETCDVQDVVRWMRQRRT